MKRFEQKLSLAELLNPAWVSYADDIHRLAGLYNQICQQVGGINSPLLVKLERILAPQAEWRDINAFLACASETRQLRLTSERWLAFWGALSLMDISQDLAQDHRYQLHDIQKLLLNEAADPMALDQIQEKYPFMRKYSANGIRPLEPVRFHSR